VPGFALPKRGRQHGAECPVCLHPNRDAIHTAKFRDKKNAREIATEFFPDVEKTPAFLSIITKHFFYMSKNIDAVTQAVLVPTRTTTGLPMLPPLSAIEQKVFSEEAKNRVDAVATVEECIRVLMDKVNHFEAQWQTIKQLTEPCETCGIEPDDNGRNFLGVLACAKELRELSERLIKFKNPTETFKHLFATTFQEYTSEVAKMYSTILVEKRDRLNEALDAYMRGEIIASVFVRRIADFGNMEVDRLTQESQALFRKLLTKAMKEIK
jgi:hypothetical protein